MLLNDVLGLPVRGPDGDLGFVTDCRLVLDGAPGPLLAGARLAGLLVGRKHTEGYLGYERTSVRSPAPLAWWFERRQRGAFLVLWRDIESITDSGVRLRAGYDRWSPEL